MPRVLVAVVLAGGLFAPALAAAQTQPTQTPTVPAGPKNGMVRAPETAPPPGHNGVIVPQQTDKSINIPPSRGNMSITKRRKHYHGTEGNPQ